MGKYKGFACVSHHLSCKIDLLVQLSHPYMTTRKIIALTRWTFVSKVMSLLFNMLSRFVNFSSKEQVSFNFMAAVTIFSDFGAQENEVVLPFPSINWGKKYLSPLAF